MKIKIVIIDSGINTNHSQIIGTDVVGFTYSGKEVLDDFEDTYGHGTAIFGIIRTVTDSADIINIKIPNIETSVLEEDLIRALQYVLDNCRCDILNLSLGINVCDDLVRLKKICDDLVARGTIIVAAHSNDGSISYPAAFENVIGVVTGQWCKKGDEFEYINDSIVNVAAKGSTQRVLWKSPEYLFVSGNSFACAHVTVQVAKFMMRGYLYRKEILSKFREQAIKCHESEQKKEKTDNRISNMQYVAIFPFNKEMHSFVRFSNLLPFKIVEAYDTKYSARIGSTTMHLLKDNNVKKLYIRNIEQIEWDKIDTIIIGHCGEMIRIIGNGIIVDNTIQEAIRREKNIYCFDDFIRKKYNYYSKIYCPRIDENDLPYSRLGMLFRISKPVVGVFGTSSKQGKFTLQLKLREIFLKQGYNLGQIGTEPHSLLFGMDYVFPMGYNSSVYIFGFDTIRYLNCIINDLCVKDKDIILVGAQSGTIHYDTGNLQQYTLPQIEFLLGTQPDAVVLCMNMFDDLDYIKRTICFIESTCRGKVIALVMFPMDLRNDWSGMYGSREKMDIEKYIYKKTKLENEFLIPLYELGNEEDMEQLVEIIKNYFQ